MRRAVIFQRAQNQPWFREYLHPSLENYFKPDPANHGSYFIGWKQHRRSVLEGELPPVDLAATPRISSGKAGSIGCGDDAGFIYEMYGFGLIREMESAPGGRIPAAQDHPALHEQQRENTRPGRSPRPHQGRLHGRSHRGRWKPAREYQSALRRRYERHSGWQKKCARSDSEWIIKDGISVQRAAALMREVKGGSSIKRARTKQQPRAAEQ